MFANRILLMRSVPVRGFSIARIALEPTKKAAPPPPPPPPAKRSAAATKVVTPAPRKAVPTKITPAVSKRAIVQTKTAAVREREREKAAKEKTKEKEKAAKEKQKEREKIVRAKEREKEKLAKAKEKEKLKAERAKALEKPYPPPPKRPGTGYIMFAHDPQVKRDRGEGVADDATKAGEAWRALSDTEREVYNKKADKLRELWKGDVAKWVASLNLAQLTAARANREPGTRDESAMETLPKRPGNAYAMFLADVTNRQDFRDKVESMAQKQSGGDDSKYRKSRIGLMGRTSADMWNTMSEKEKAVYVNKAADAKKQWDKNFGTLIATQKEAFAATLP